jgi:hypothetical protein
MEAYRDGGIIPFLTLTLYTGNWFIHVTHARFLEYDSKTLVYITEGKLFYQLRERKSIQSVQEVNENSVFEIGGYS